MTDKQAEELLELLWLYVQENGDTTTEDNMYAISDIADDLSMSMKRTTDRADELRVLIERALP